MLASLIMMALRNMLLTDNKGALIADHSETFLFEHFHNKMYKKAKTCTMHLLSCGLNLKNFSYSFETQRTL